MSSGLDHRLRIDKGPFDISVRCRSIPRKPLHTNSFFLLFVLLHLQAGNRAGKVSARQGAYVRVSAIVIAEAVAFQLLVEGRMFVQVKAQNQSVGRARRRGPKAERKPLAQAHAARFASRFKDVQKSVTGSWNLTT